MLPIRTILHPTDLSAEGEAAFQLACSVARDCGARLILLHVYPPPLNRAELAARAQPVSYEEDLDAAMHRLQARGVTADYRLEEGNPAEVILRTAAETPCDLIVMGTHGRTGLSRLLLGSVAEAVLRRARCPVLTVKMPHPDEDADWRPSEVVAAEE